LHEKTPHLHLFSGFLGGDEVIRDISFIKSENGNQKKNFHFRVKGIPTTFEDGASGTTLWMENVTPEREHIKNLEFLARTSAELADLSEDADVHQYIADRIQELEPGCFAGVCTIDQEKNTITLMRFAINPEDMQYVQERFPQLFEGFSFSLDVDPDAEMLWSKKSLVEAPKLYYLFFQQLPESLTDSIEEHLSLGKGYTMGCICRNGLYGDVIIKLKKGSELTHKETIEAFLSQAALALQRRHMREKLRRAEDRIRTLEQGAEIDP